MIAASLRMQVIALALAVACAQLAIVAGCAAPTDRPEAELRTVDELLSLIKARLEQAADAAHDAWISGSPPEEPAKADELVDAAVNRASEYTLPPEVVRDFFSAQIGAASYVRTVLHTQWQAKPESRPRASAGKPQKVQPRVEPTSIPLLAALSKAYPILRSSGGRDLLLKRAEGRFADVPGGVKTMVLALTPLSRVAN